MDINKLLLDAGFARVLVLDGPSCGIEAARLILAVWTYEAEAKPAQQAGWIHPYYPAAQKAYRAACDAVRAMQEAGLPAMLRDDVRVKPIFARLPGFSQGYNTLSYVEGVGSRFHVQIITLDMPIPVTHVLEDTPHPLHCGDCRLCMDVCPTHAIDEDGFHIERCIRRWMMSGKPVPEDIRAAMGNRLIGCDECQRRCPHNPEAAGASGDAVSLAELLQFPKAMAERLKQSIGANLALPNRVLSQGCLMAGCSGRPELLPMLRELAGHPSPTVQEHAAWAAMQIEKKLQEP